MDGYYKDRRVVAGLTNSLFDRIDQTRMIGYLSPSFIESFLEVEDDIEPPQEVKIVFEVCPTCEGKGTHVNPSIDSHGLTAEDFREDPDFMEAYLGGRYDQPCNECRGDRVVPVPDENDEKSKPFLDRFYKWQDRQARYARERAQELAMGY